jgi:DNA-binding GntR family transcriptional regulator
MRSTTPKPYEMVVAKKLLAVANRGVARVSYDQLEEETGYSRRTIQLALTNLERDGATKNLRARAGIREIRLVQKHWIWDVARALKEVG